LEERGLTGPLSLKRLGSAGGGERKAFQEKGPGCRGVGPIESLTSDSSRAYGKRNGIKSHNKKGRRKDGSRVSEPLSKKRAFSKRSPTPSSRKGDRQTKNGKKESLGRSPLRGEKELYKGKEEGGCQPTFWYGKGSRPLNEEYRE